MTENEVKREETLEETKKDFSMTSGTVASAAETPPDPNALLEIRHLKKYFPVATNFFGRPTKFLKAVDDVSFKIKKGTTLGIVGESGCGKTTLGRTILRLQPATSGQIYFEEKDINKLNTSEMNKLRPSMQIIFQDPYSSLSPRMPVGEIIGEAVAEHQLVPKNELKEYVLGVMKKCGLPYHYYERYPHEFSAVSASVSVSLRRLL